MGGACDGGLHVPHSVNKYPGYFKEGVLMTPLFISQESWDSTSITIWTSLEKMRKITINNSQNGISAYKRLRSRIAKLFSKRFTKVSERTQHTKKLSIKNNQLNGQMPEKPYVRLQRVSI